MTAHRDLKRIIRERRSKTGESYSAARVHVMRERATLLGLVASVGTMFAAAEAGTRCRSARPSMPEALRILDPRGRVASPRGGTSPDGIKEASLGE
jgi:hypothetical protein